MFLDNIKIKITNRWIVAIGAIIIQLALGTIYSWSTLSAVVSPYIGVPKQTSVFIFGVGLLSFAITMIFAGQISAKIGPMRASMLGGLVLGIGVILTAAMHSLAGMIITYGILFGAGIGFAYVVPIATAQKWFPDMVGLITGIAVAGFGAGAFIFNFVIKAFEPLGIPLLFILLGLILMILIFGASITMQLPPAGYQPVNWTPPAPKAGIVGVDMKRSIMIKTSSFWILWVMYTLSALAGLMVIGAYSAFSTAQSGGIYLHPKIVLTTQEIALVGGIAALFNGLGRIIWGKIADIITYKRAMTIMLIIQSAAMYIYFFTNINVSFFIIMTCVIIFCFGGNLSLFPTATKDLFGAKNFSSNYGYVFTAYGIAGFLGATMVQTFVNIFGGYMQLFLIVGSLSVVCLILSFFLRAPKLGEESTPLGQK